MRSPHYLTPLLTDRLPRYHVAIDCETAASKRHGRTAHRWVCGAWAYGELSPDVGFTYDVATATNDAARLWEGVRDCHIFASEIVVWAHNLAFDLRVSEGLRHLPALGYSLEAIVLEKTASWASFTSPKGNLTLCDLHSWLPASLNRVAAAMGKGRPNLVYHKAKPEELWGRCTEDAETTLQAIGELLEWLEANEPGGFRPTGSGQSHSMWRRRWLPRKTVMVHGDEQALERERTAMWTGRAEAWKWGEVKGPLYEHDLNLAYCRIAADNAVPVKLVQRTGRTPVEAYLQAVKFHAILADVTVTTLTESVPTSEDGRVFWPIGKFRTTLWEPELSLLIEEGAHVDIHRTWKYRRDFALAEMAQYLIGELEAGGEGASPVVRIMLKHWARTLVGRCALRYREWDDYGTLPTMGLSLSTMFDLDSGEATELLQVGNRVMELTRMAEADSSVPQITGWVMSRARANLWRLMCQAGLGNLYYIDTDSLIVNGQGDRRLMQSKLHPVDTVLIAKAEYRKAKIYGPRNLVLEDERRLSGVPVKAIRTGPLTFDGEVWSGLRASLEQRRPSEVGISPRTFDVEDADPRRKRCPDGGSEPFYMGDDVNV